MPAVLNGAPSLHILDAWFVDLCIEAVIDWVVATSYY